MRILLALLAVLGLEKRNQEAAQKLADAKAAYEAALAKTGDFDCVAPEFDAVLKLFDSVPAATPSKKEAKDVAKRIREKRTAAAKHARALDAASSAPLPAPFVPESSASAAGAAATDSGAAAGRADPQSCKAARKKMVAFALARKRAGKPPLGTMAFTNAGEVAFAPGAEPTAEEATLQETLKHCG